MPTEPIIPVARQDWLDVAVSEHVRTMKLLRASKVPEVLIGSFVVTMCRRLLRCVYGSDLEAACALRKMVIDEEYERTGRVITP